MAVDGTASDEEIIRAVENAGYGARLKGEERKESLLRKNWHRKRNPWPTMKRRSLKRRLMWSAGFLALLMYITMGHNMLGWPVPAFFDNNHLGLALTEMLLALIVMYVNRDFFLFRLFKASVVRPLDRDSSVFPTVISAGIMAADSK